jgi:hypothetical protein
MTGPPPSALVGLATLILGFNGGNLGDSPAVTSLPFWCREPGGNDLQDLRLGKESCSQGKYVGVIVLPAVTRRGDIVAHRRPNARDLIRGHAGADSRCVQDNSEITLLVCDSPAYRVGKIRVIDGIRSRRTKVPDRTAETAEVERDELLHFESSVIRGKRDEARHGLSSWLETKLDTTRLQQIPGQWGHPRPFSQQKQCAHGEIPNLGLGDHLVNRLIKDPLLKLGLSRGGGDM